LLGSSFWQVYLSLLASVLVALVFVGLFERYATTDFASMAAFLQDHADAIEVLAEVVESEREGPGERSLFEDDPPPEALEQRFGPEARERLEEVRPDAAPGLPVGAIVLLHLLTLGLWLVPVYRYMASGHNSARAERRILNSSLVVLLLPWLIGGLDLALKLLQEAAAPVSLDARTLAIYIASYLIFASLVSHFTLSVTARTITERVADRAFQGELRYRLKPGFTLSLVGRLGLLIVAIAIVPLLVNIYIPIAFHGWALAEIRAAENPDWIRLARIVTPIAATGLANLFFIGEQLFSIFTFRRSIQHPINTLIDRMKRVARGDLSTRSSVLSGDEIGQLKGHFNLMVEGLQEREKLRDTFGRYVSTEIAEKLMSSGEIDLAGEEIETTVMFSDIRSFTSLSERSSPRELIAFLNEYFQYMVEPILEHHGVVNKFIGDSVMAVFSPVFGIKDHPAAALRAGLAMREALARFNALGRSEPVRHGIGIHTGVLVAGTVGTEERMEYTVVGDTVNVAARIESQTKMLGVDLLASADTIGALSPAERAELSLEPTEPMTLRGKSQPLVLYAVR